MAGLRPGHPRLPWAMKKDVDARDKRGHDDKFQSSPFRDAPLGAGRNQPLQRCVALILRSALLRASRRMATWVHPAVLRDAAKRPLLRMRAELGRASGITAIKSPP